MKTLRQILAAMLLCMLGGSLSAQEIKTLPPVTVTSSANVPQRVAESFDKAFPTSYNDRWFKADRNYLVKFMVEDQKNTALFRKNGSLVYHLGYGFEKDLPTDVRKHVKSQYVDFKITTAIKVEQGNRLIWVINLEDPKKFIVVRYEDGELEEVGNYDLAK